MHGVLSDGRRIDCVMSGARSGAGGESGADGALIGQAVENGRWWVKGRLSDGNWLLSRGEGYTVQNLVLAEPPAR